MRRRNESAAGGEEAVRDAPLDSIHNRKQPGCGRFTSDLTGQILGGVADQRRLLVFQVGADDLVGTRIHFRQIGGSEEMEAFVARNPGRGADRLRLSVEVDDPRIGKGAPQLLHLK